MSAASSRLLPSTVEILAQAALRGRRGAPDSAQPSVWAHFAPGVKLHAREALERSFSNAHEAALWEAEMTRGPFRALLAPSGRIVILDARRRWDDQHIATEGNKADAKRTIDRFFAALERGEEPNPEMSP